MRARALILAGCLLWASSALGDERSDFEKARIAYIKKDYVDADARFSAMLDGKTGTLKTQALIDEAQFGWGAVKFAKGDSQAAHVLWEKVIRDTMGQYQPDLLTYPTEVINDFLSERDRLRETLLQQQTDQAAKASAQRRHDAEERARLEARVKDLEGIASTETVVTNNSRLAALVPFGVGQFQNRQKALGWFFLAAEGAALLATAVLFIPYRYNVDQANAIWNDSTPNTWNNRTKVANEYAAVAQDIRTADFITLGALGAFVVAGVIQAEIAFKPTFSSTRPRKLGSFWPSISPVTGGGVAGIGGRF